MDRRGKFGSRETSHSSALRSRSRRMPSSRPGDSAPRASRSTGRSRGSRPSWAAAIDANLRARSLRTWARSPSTNWAWGRPHIPDRRAPRGRPPLSDAWRIDTIRGDLAGGVAQGAAWGETPARGPRSASFELETDRAVLSKLLAIAPSLAKRVEGFGTPDRKMQDVLDANAEPTVTTARLGGAVDRRPPRAGRVHLSSGRGPRHPSDAPMDRPRRRGPRPGHGLAPGRCRQVVRGELPTSTSSR